MLRITTPEIATGSSERVVAGSSDRSRSPNEDGSERIVNRTANSINQPVSPADRVISKPKARRDTVLEFIRSAQHSLVLSLFRCDDLMVLNEIGHAVTRGVHVEVLVTTRAKGWAGRLGPLAGCLTHMGVTVHRCGTRFAKYHAKYMVADRNAALIATLNLTRKCFSRTRDFLLVTHDQAVVQSLVSLFQADLAGVEAAPAGGRLVIGPDQSRGRIESALRGAQRSIRILDHKLSDPGILRILHERARAGVEVEVASGKHQDGLTPHGRIIIIDDSTALFGSFALTAQSIDQRRELAVFIHEPELVIKLNRQFQKASERALREAA